MANPLIAMRKIMSIGSASKAFSQAGLGAMAFGAITGYLGSEGSKTQRIAQGAISAVGYSFAPGIMFAGQVAKAASSFGEQFQRNVYERPWEREAMYGANFGGTFRDTQQAATMRQRALQNLGNSVSNSRSVLGSEARTYHRSGAYHY